MDQNQKVRIALENMLTSRSGLNGARQQLENAEEYAKKCKTEALRQILARGNKPVLFRGVMYRIEPTPVELPDIFHEEPIEFIDLTEENEP